MVNKNNKSKETEIPMLKRKSKEEVKKAIEEGLKKGTKASYKPATKEAHLTIFNQYTQNKEVIFQCKLPKAAQDLQWLKHPGNMRKECEALKIKMAAEGKTAEDTEKALAEFRKAAETKVDAESHSCQEFLRMKKHLLVDLLNELTDKQLTELNHALKGVQALKTTQGKSQINEQCFKNWVDSINILFDGEVEVYPWAPTTK